MSNPRVIVSQAVSVCLVCLWGFASSIVFDCGLLSSLDFPSLPFPYPTPSSFKPGPHPLTNYHATCTYQTPDHPLPRAPARPRPSISSPPPLQGSSVQATTHSPPRPNLEIYQPSELLTASPPLVLPTAYLTRRTTRASTSQRLPITRNIQKPIRPGGRLASSSFQPNDFRIATTATATATPRSLDPQAGRCAFGPPLTGIAPFLTPASLSPLSQLPGGANHPFKTIVAEGLRATSKITTSRERPTMF